MSPSLVEVFAAGPAKKCAGCCKQEKREKLASEGCGIWNRMSCGAAFLLSLAGAFMPGDVKLLHSQRLRGEKDDNFKLAAS